MDQTNQIMKAMGFKIKASPILRAPFGYPGGKSKSLKQILPLLPYRERYVEVFGGSGVVLLNRKPSPIEVFNDRHSGLTSFYKCLHDPQLLSQLVDMVESTIHSRDFWYWAKETWEQQTTDLDRGFRWYYMTRYSFSQMGRNFGRSIATKNADSGKLRSIPMMGEIHSRLYNVLIENQDWRELFKELDSTGTVFYLDPPYYDTQANIYKHSFSVEEHKALLEGIFGLKGFVALSGYDNELYNSYPWTEKHEWDVRVAIGGSSASDGNNRDLALPVGTAKEVVWIRE